MRVSRLCVCMYIIIRMIWMCICQTMNGDHTYVHADTNQRTHIHAHRVRYSVCVRAWMIHTSTGASPVKCRTHTVATREFFACMIPNTHAHNSNCGYVTVPFMYVRARLCLCVNVCSSNIAISIHVFFAATIASAAAAAPADLLSLTFFFLSLTLFKTHNDLIFNSIIHIHLLLAGFSFVSVYIAFARLFCSIFMLI